MKKLALTLLAVAATTLSTGAMAQFYVSGDIGQGHASVDCSGIASCSKNDTAFKVTGGYKFGKGFAAEVGYVDFGNATGNDQGVSAQIGAKAFTVGGAYELPFAPQWNGVARLGLASVETKISGSIAGLGGYSQSETNTEAYYGLGVNFAVARNVKIEAAIDWSHLGFQGESGVVRAITVGGRYEF
jgi:opacity protein-like surface antigen